MEHKIQIVTNSKFKPVRMVVSVAVQIGVIYLGVLANSSAMQWTGFVALVLLLFAVAISELNRNKDLTIDEARRRLDEIETKQR